MDVIFILGGVCCGGTGVVGLDVVDFGQVLRLVGRGRTVG